MLQVGIFALLLVFLFFGERWLRKKLHIPKTRGFFYERVNKTQTWIENGIFILFLVAEFPYFLFLHGQPPILFIMILGAFFVAQQAVRFFYERKYRKEDREYIMILIWGIIYFPIIAAVFLLLLHA